MNAMRRRSQHRLDRIDDIFWEDPCHCRTPEIPTQKNHAALLSSRAAEIAMIDRFCLRHLMHFLQQKVATAIRKPRFSQKPLEGSNERQAVPGQKRRNATSHGSLAHCLPTIPPWSPWFLYLATPSLGLGFPAREISNIGLKILGGGQKGR